MAPSEVYAGAVPLERVYSAPRACPVLLRDLFLYVPPSRLPYISLSSAVTCLVAAESGSGSPQVYLSLSYSAASSATLNCSARNLASGNPPMRSSP